MFKKERSAVQSEYVQEKQRAHRVHQDGQVRRLPAAESLVASIFHVLFLTSHVNHSIKNPLNLVL